MATQTPPGKPPGMPAEVFASANSLAHRARSALAEAYPVREYDVSVEEGGRVVVSLTTDLTGTAAFLDRLMLDLGFDVASVDWGSYSDRGAPPIRALDLALVADAA